MAFFSTPRETQREKRFEIQLDDCLRDKIEHAIGEVRVLLEGSKPRIPTKKPGKCKACKYLEMPMEDRPRLHDGGLVVSLQGEPQRGVADQSSRDFRISF